MTSPNETTLPHRPDDDNSTQSEPGRDIGEGSPGPDQVGRYRRLTELARGGMGVVYRADDPVFARDVAIKLLHKRFRGSSGAVARFLDEARITGQLQHPGIPPVFEVGLLPDESPYLAMKLIRGRTLAGALTGLTFAERMRFVPVFEQVCQAVAYAHDQRVIHRDLKPANIMVGSFGEVQVMDWGVAKVLDAVPVPAPEPVATTTVPYAVDLGGTKTQAGDILGTPAYMPPEQAVGAVDQIDRRSDVFGLGAILCAILTGEAPYVGETSDSVRILAARGKVEDAFRRLEACGAEPGLVALARRCLAPEPSERPRDAGEVAQVVADLRTAADERARQAELDRVRAQAERTAAVLKTAEERKRRRAQAALAAAVVLLIGFGGVAAWFVQKSADEKRLQVQAAEDARRRTRDGVEAALAQLPELSQRALWSQANAVLDQADQRVTADDDPGLREKIQLARTNTAFIQRLDEVRHSRVVLVGGKFDMAGTSARYAETFRAHGLDVLSRRPEDLAAAMKDSPIRDYILAALDDWIVAADSPTVDRLASAMFAMTGQDWRRSFFLSWRDAEKLKEEFAEVPTADLTPSLIASVGFVLNLLGADGVTVLEAGLRQHPSDFWLHYNLGLAGGKERSVEKLAACRAALAVRPGTAIVYNLMGWIRKDAGDLNGAVADYREAIRLDPKTLVPRLNLAVALSRVGNHAAAIAADRESIALFPDDPLPHSNLAVVYYFQRKYDEAIAAAQDALKRDAKCVPAWTNLSWARFAKSDLPGAEAAARQGVSLDPKDPKPWNILGIIRVTRGDADEAISAFRKSIETGTDEAAPYANIAFLLRQRGDLAEAEAIAREAVEQFPNDPDGYAHLAQILRSCGAYAASAEVYRQLIQLRPRLATAHNNLGLQLLSLRDFDGARAACQQALANNSKLANAHGNLGLVLLADGDYAGSLTSLKRAASLHSSFKDYAEWVERLQPMADRIPELISGKQTVTNNRERLDLARLCDLLGRCALATRLFALALESDPTLAGDLSAGERYYAAEAAARAGTRLGIDTVKLTAAEFAALRQQALDWLRADLAQRETEAAGSLSQRSETAQELSDWLINGSFAGTRAGLHRIGWSPAEMAAWDDFWRDVKHLYRSTSRPLEPAPEPRRAGGHLSHAKNV